MLTEWHSWKEYGVTLDCHHKLFISMASSFYIKKVSVNSGDGLYGIHSTRINKELTVDHRSRDRYIELS